MNSANNRPAATGWHAGNVALLLVRTSMAGLALHGVVIGANAFYDADDIFIYYGPTGISLQSVSSSGPTGSRDLLPHGMAVSTDATVQFPPGVDLRRPEAFTFSHCLRPRPEPQGWTAFTRRLHEFLTFRGVCVRSLLG